MPFYHPSPASWSEQVLYLIMVDRFATGQEDGVLDEWGQPQLGSIPRADVTNHHALQQSQDIDQNWRQAGAHFCGGNLRGIITKLGYLHRLGITTLWLSPVLKQPAFDTTMYHGYGTQDFTKVDPRFGSVSDLIELIAKAHQLGMYVVLDVIINHAGNVLGYDVTEESDEKPVFNKDSYTIKGWRDAQGNPSLPLSSIEVKNNEAIWPLELQTDSAFHKYGCITNWEEPEQYLTGDFKTLKDFNLGTGWLDDFHPSQTLHVLTKTYCEWIKKTDLDGIRLDAVKHMPPGAVRYFVTEIQKTTLTLGKRNFLLAGEIPDGQHKAHQTLAETGLTTALGILDIPPLVEKICLGTANPAEFFAFSSASINQELHPESWKPEELITLYDDHDQISKGYHKARFAHLAQSTEQQFTPLFLLLTTMGIPSIYYGSEQGFDGWGEDDDFIRECMFGGKFGPFRSTENHFFVENGYVFKNTAKLLAIRKKYCGQNDKQELLKISGNNTNFGYPQMIGGSIKSVVPWIRHTLHGSLLCLFNTDPFEQRAAYIQMPQKVHHYTEVFSTHKRNSITFFNESTEVILAPSGCALYLLA